MDPTYSNVPVSPDFWYNLGSGVQTILNAYAQASAINNQNKLQSVLTNPNTTAGGIYTTGIAAGPGSSYTLIIILLFIIVVVWLIFN